MRRRRFQKFLNLIYVCIYMYNFFVIYVTNKWVYLKYCEMYYF